jgi:hypothetical protein
MVTRSLFDRLGWRNALKERDVLKAGQILAVIVLAALAGLSPHGPAGSAEKRTEAASPIQCACCTKPNRNAYPRVHCRFLCDKGGPFDRVFFEPRSARLTPTAKEILRRQAICLKRNNFGATLWGSADFHELPKRNSLKRLAKRRTATVKSYLAARGIPASVIKAKLVWELDGVAFGGRTSRERRANRSVATWFDDQQ